MANINTINLDDNTYQLRPHGICNTLGETIIKMVSIEDFTLFNGATVLVSFSYSNTASNPQLNVNNQGSKPIIWNGIVPIIEAGVVYEFYYDGTNWIMLGHDQTELKNELNNMNEDITSVDNKINALVAGFLQLQGSGGKTIYKNTTNSITITGTIKDNSGIVKDEDVEEIIIKQGSTNLANTTKQKSLSYTNGSFITSDTTTTFNISAKVMGTTLTTSVKIYAYYPIYYGMATNASSLDNFTKLKVTNTVARTYSATATTNGQRFYLLVPTDISSPKSFKMGGAPVDMVKPQQTVTLSGIPYYIFYTNATYNAGAKVEIEVE